MDLNNSIYSATNKIIVYGTVAEEYLREIISKKLKFNFILNSHNEALYTFC
jgi:hypothetical protein